jgi:hypothetical protein
MNYTDALANAETCADCHEYAEDLLAAHFTPLEEHLYALCRVALRRLEEEGTCPSAALVLRSGLQLKRLDHIKHKE